MTPELLFEHNMKAFLARYPQEGEALVSRLSKNRQVRTVPLLSTAATKLEKTSGIRLVLFLGLGDGELFAKLYATAAKHKNLQFVLLELSDDVLASVFKRLDLTAAIADERCSWFVGLEPAKVRYQFREYCRQDVHLMAMGSVLRVPCHTDDKAEEYARIETLFNETAQKAYVSRQQAPAEDNYRGLLNILRNGKIIPQLPMLDKLIGAFKGKPGIVVAAGPSLKSSLEFLKAHQDRAVLFCVDSVLQVLLKNGITPHFAACMERIPETAELFAGMPEAPHTWLVANPVVVPETFEAYRGPKCFFLRQSTHLPWFFPEEQIHDMGLSCAHMAFWGLHLMGCDPIILLGQDLAFDRQSENTHTEGTPEIVRQIAGKARDESQDWVEGNDGKPILSWDFFINSVASYDVLIRRSGKLVINAINAERGAKIPRTQRLDPLEALSRLPASAGEGVREVIEEKFRMSPSEQTRREDYFHAQLGRGIAFFEEKLVPQITDLLNQISVFYQYHLPNIPRADTKAQYDSLFSLVEKLGKEIMGEKGGDYARLLYPLLSSRALFTSVRITDIEREETDLSLKIRLKVSVLQNFYSEMLTWTVRLLELFRSVKNNNFFLKFPQKIP